mmetsp:Transcript_15522/g.17873  ORF Transcript_15522/g.17873 Transcript_15522/m.17873 type:complete len:453 (+) Transcript_15522:171-1529(+)
MFQIVAMVLFATTIALLAGTVYVKLRSGSAKSIFYSFLDSVMFIPYTLRIGPFAAHDNGIERTCIDAMKRTGLNDFDDSGKFSFMKPYAMSHDFGYVRSKCFYSPMGFLVQKLSQQKRMEIRLLMVDYFKRHPSVETTTFSRPPTLITGFTRTGTTYLHELLSIHPETRAHNTWEQMNPVPTTDDESPLAQQQNRIERHKKGLRLFKFVDRVAGEISQAVHKVEYDKCEECTLPCSLELPWNITNLSFMMFAAEELFSLGAGRSFDLYLKFLKLQTWSAPDLPSHWVVKCPFYLPFLNDLNETFSDSTIVWTHRNPVECIASTCLLFECITHSTCSSWIVDKKWLGQHVLKYTRLSFDRAFYVLKRRKGDIRIIHVKYRDTTKATLETCERVCKLIGLPFSDEYVSILKEHIAKSREKRKIQVEKYKYTLDEYGMTKAGLEAEFKEYIETYC